MVDLAETVGLDTLSELWRDAPADSLPGALWALYLLRTWTERQGDALARMYRAGRAYAPVDEVVAGVADDADPAAVRALAEAVLTGAYQGDFDVALERAASFFRVIATGRRELAGARGTTVRSSSWPSATSGARRRCGGRRPRGGTARCADARRDRLGIVGPTG